MCLAGVRLFHRVALVLPLLLAPVACRSLSAQTDSALADLVAVLRQTADPQFQLDVLRGMRDGLQGRRGVSMPAGWENASAKLGQSANHEVRELTLALSLTFGSTAALTSLRQTVGDTQATTEARRRALESLLKVKDPGLVPALERLLGDPALGDPALRGLANYDDAQIPSMILSVYPSLKDAERKAALGTLVSRLIFARPLLAAVEAGTVSPRDLTADFVRQLRHFEDNRMDQQIEKLWGVSRESPADKLADIAKYKTMITTKGPGEPRRGRVVFSRVCQQCHTLFDTGARVGPELTGSNRGDLDYVLQNVIDPNAIIPNDYRAWILETKDDRVITGIVRRQDNTAVTILLPGEEIVVPRNEIQSLRQGEISLMPEGLLQSMTDDEVRDLVAYLRSPRQVPLPAGEAKANP